jgi:hypothetical protein
VARIPWRLHPVIALLQAKYRARWCGQCTVAAQDTIIWIFAVYSYIDSWYRLLVGECSWITNVLNLQRQSTCNQWQWHYCECGQSYRHLYIWPHNPDSLALDPILSTGSWRSIIIITTWVRVFLRHLTFTYRQPCRGTATGSRPLAFVKWGAALLGNQSGVLQPGRYRVLLYSVRLLSCG